MIHQSTSAREEQYNTQRMRRGGQKHAIVAVVVVAHTITLLTDYGADGCLMGSHQSTKVVRQFYLQVCRLETKQVFGSLRPTDPHPPNSQSVRYT